MVIASFSAFIVSASAAADTVSLPSESAPSNQENIIPAENTSLDIDESTEDTYDIIGEDVTKRDQFSKHYLCSDGSYVAVVCAETIHYQTDDGSWEEVDNTLSLDSSSEYYKNDKSKSDFGVSFSKNPNKEDAVVLSDGETSISWYIEGLKSGNNGNNKVNPSNSSKVKINNNKSNANSRLNGKSGKENSAISYENIFGEDIGAVLKYSVSENRIEEDIIFERVPQISSYTMNIRAPGMEVSLNEDGSVDIVAKNGKVSYIIDAPIMYDAAGVYSANVAVSVERHGNIIKVTYTPDMSWLEAPERVYPVTLDPVVTTSQYTSNITDTYISEHASFSDETATIATGNHASFGKMISYIKFNNIPSFGEYVYPTKAQVLLYSTNALMDLSYLKMSYVTSTWNASSITYSSRPTSYTLCLNSDITRSATEDLFDSEEYEYYPCYEYSFDFTYAIEDHMDEYGEGIDSYWDSYYGFAVEYIGSSYTNISFISSEHDSQSHRPVLVLSYEPEIPNFLSDGGIYNFYNVFSGTYLSADETYANVLESSVSSLTIEESFKIIESTTDDGEFNGYKLGIMASDTHALYGYSTQGVFNEYEMAISVSSISDAKADNQDWIIRHVDCDMYVIALRDCPDLVLSVYDDGGVYYLNLEYFNDSSQQLWEIHSSGEQLYHDMLNVSDLFGDPQPVCEIREGQSVDLFCPIFNYGESVAFYNGSSSAGTISASNVLTAVHAGTVPIDVAIYNAEGDEDSLYEIEIDVILNNGVYSISAPNGKVLTVEGATSYDEAPVILADYTEGLHQKWRIKYLGDNWYSVRPLLDLTKALDVTDCVDIFEVGTSDSLSYVPEYARWSIKYQNSEYTFFNDNESLYLTASSDESIVSYYGSTYGVQQFNLSVSASSSGVVLSDIPEELVAGKNYDIFAVVYTPTLIYQTIGWSSSNTNVAVLSSSGVITTRSAGSVTFTAILANSDASFTVSVSPETIVVPCAYGRAAPYADKAFPVYLNNYLNSYSSLLSNVTWSVYENNAIIFDSTQMAVTGIDTNIAWLEAHNSYGLVFLCYIVVEDIFAGFDSAVKQYLHADGSFLGMLSLGEYNRNDKIDPLILRTEWYLYITNLSKQGYSSEEIQEQFEEQFNFPAQSENAWQAFLGEIEFGEKGGYARENLRLSFDGLKSLLNFYWFQYAVYGLASIDTVNVYTPANQYDIVLNKRESMRVSQERHAEQIINSAKSAQSSWNYNEDNFGMKLLKKGTRVYRLCDSSGTPGRWTTDGEIAKIAKYDYTTTLQGLQVNPDGNTRYYLGQFVVTKDTYVAYGQILANPQYGSGGFIQFFFPNPSDSLAYISKIPLQNIP